MLLKVVNSNEGIHPSSLMFVLNSSEGTHVSKAPWPWYQCSMQSSTLRSVYIIITDLAKMISILCCYYKFYPTDL